MIPLIIYLFQLKIGQCTGCGWNTIAFELNAVDSCKVIIIPFLGLFRIPILSIISFSLPVNV